MLKQYPTLRFVLMRAGWYFLTFLVAVTINFFLPRLGKNNPVDIIMGKAATGLSNEDARKKEEKYLQEFGLAKVGKDGQLLRDSEGKPVKAGRLEQFGNYIKMCLVGDLGTSFQKYPKKVIDVIKEAVPWTIALQLPTILFGWIVGNVLGALAAYRRGVFDKVFFPLALILSSFPFFVFGMLLVYYFAVVFPWFPAMGGYANSLTPSFSAAFLTSSKSRPNCSLKDFRDSSAPRISSRMPSSKAAVSALSRSRSEMIFSPWAVMAFLTSSVS